MKRPSIVLLLASFLLLPISLTAQTVLLGVDFNSGVGDPSPNQAGFSPFIKVSTTNTSGPLSQTYTGLNTSYTSSGSITVTVASGTSITSTGVFISRDRDTIAANSGTFTYRDLYRDILIASASPLSLGFSGLAANTEYQIRLFAYDNSGSKTMTFTDYTSGSAGASGSVIYTSGYAFTDTTDNNIFSTVLTVTSNASGQIIIRGTPNSGDAVINGFQILSGSTIPEPSSFAILAGFASLVGVLGFRRGRRSRIQ